ncbi:Flp pilus assembly protein secretin CpaC [Novosphingobium barchaimii LL02]|uniref:Flp pilus assembly protein secretin CpaC n=1 Tax=Novosphingobium barchaimii LL02 TaxID=1114963 RepID=A0A0J7XH72_9SPHN|nr:pilus assembly protein N-terminal domain-containing protein [Novosphingobium barchaimii]KMS51117.1 Flp pilus assembly protein secretin CpaC [Novosphingobium barchaimii LL02]
MKVLMAKGPIVAGLLALAAPAVLAPSIAAAQEGRALQVDEARTLSFSRAIGRVEVSRENVISVSAPSTRSLRITGLGAGQATLSVYAPDGSLIEEGQIQVDPAPPSFSNGSGPLRAGEKVVAVDLQFAAVSSSTLKALGFSFSKLSGDLQGAVVSPSSLNSYSFGGSGLSVNASAPIQSAFNLFLSAPNRGIGAVLSALSTNGLSQLLAQPTLLVRSGAQAEFLAGGEVPVPVPQSNGGTGNSISIEYKKFGVSLKVRPFVLSENNIVLEIEPEVSELDYSNGVQLQGYVVPGFRNRSAKTTVELGSGQSFVIAGLNYTNSSVTKDKVPFLGDIPVLGAFFKRQQNQKERQELIIVATPRLVEPEAVRPVLADNMKTLDPGVGQMIVGNDGVEQATKSFGVVRR